MSRLVVVSNRVAPADERKTQAGGLALAMRAALRSKGGVWFGWSGEIVETTPAAPRIDEAGPIQFATLDLGQRDHDDYYLGFANSTLWPLFHYRLDLANLSRQTFDGYLRVNRVFAKALIPLLRPDDHIWIQDYHLIPLAQMLRELGCRQRIGFFLHTTFPSPELLVALPPHAFLAGALCAHDVIGFQTLSDVRCFVNYIRDETRGSARYLDGQSGENGYVIEAFGRRALARAFPISIDTPALQQAAQKASSTAQTRRLVASVTGRQLIIGVDRLDYSKGLPQRFESYGTFLETYPEHRGQVSFLQIAPPSRSDVPEYQVIRARLETLSGHINGTYAEYDWIPLRYLNKAFPHATLAGFLRVSRIGLVTPLRDGMNLVAKEYVACQDPENPGVLVLSRFAGAARELPQAVIVNPHDTEGVADALKRALSMPLEERRERHAAMMRVLTTNTIASWRQNFLDALAAAPVAAAA